MLKAAKLPILPLRPPAAAVALPSDKKDKIPPEHQRDDKVHDKPKSTRAGKPKVRTGCVTCKIRRVKCDEAKPACQRCTSTGRTCDGYVTVAKRSARRCNPLTNGSRTHGAPSENAVCTNLKLPLRRLPGLAMTSAEGRALGYFHSQTVAALSSHFDGDFWGRLILQVGHLEPAVCHAMIAMGAFHESRESVSALDPSRMCSHSALMQVTSSIAGKLATRNHNEPFALAQYNKAISCLTRRIGSATWTSEMTLLVCILFICIEFLRGDASQALRHFSSGMNIVLTALRDHQTRKVVSTADRLLLQNDLLPFFNRLEILAGLWSSPVLHPYTTPPEEAIPEQFDSIHDARNSIVHLLNLAMRFIKSVKLSRFVAGITSVDRKTQSDLRARLLLWNTRLAALLENPDRQVSTRDRRAAKILRVQQLVAQIWIETCTERDDLRGDDFHREWTLIITLAEDVLATQAPAETFTFTFEMELVSPLFFVCICCRFPLLRRRALDVLDRVSRREGLWDSHAAATIGRRIMELEEARLSSWDGSQLPADEDRVYNTEICSRPGIDPRRHVVVFYQRAREDEVAGSVDDAGIADGMSTWKVWKEEFQLDPPLGESPPLDAFGKVRKKGASSRFLIRTSEMPAQLLPILFDAE